MTCSLCSAHQEAREAMATTTGKIPQDIIDAMESETPLTEDQLRRLIEAEAEMIGLTFDEAVELDRRGALPKNALGSDIHFLLLLLFYEPPEQRNNVGNSGI